MHVSVILLVLHTENKTIIMQISKGVSFWEITRKPVRLFSRRFKIHNQTNWSTTKRFNDKLTEEGLCVMVFWNKVGKIRILNKRYWVGEKRQTIYGIPEEDDKWRKSWEGKELEWSCLALLGRRLSLLMWKTPRYLMEPDLEYCGETDAFHVGCHFLKWNL